MKRWMFVLAPLYATMGCAGGPAGPGESVFNASSPAAFAGEWRSVTPSLEFIGLAVASKSSERDVLGARLTFSGLAWEGGGRIAGDSLVAGMTVVGATTASGVIVARARDAQTLRVRFRGGSGAPLDLTFVRED